MNSSGDGSKDGGLKRQNVSVAGVEETLDRISQLTDTLQNLSILPTKDAFTTCILSKSCHHSHQSSRILVRDYLQKLSSATELTIGSWFTEVPCMLQFKGLPIPELKCKYLTLELYMENFDLNGLAGLLGASPHVETLNTDLKENLLARHFCNFDEDNVDLQSWISSFVFSNLKNVKIFNSSQVCLKVVGPGTIFSTPNKKQGFDKLLKLSKLLLKNATTLEKFFIISGRRKCKRCFMDCEFDFFFGLVKKMVSFPTSSTNSVIRFQV